MKKKKVNWLPVVAAIIRREGKILIGQRPENKSLPGLWEFPGGKIEYGETPELALVRELKEELGIEAEVGPIKLAATHQYPDIGVLLLFYEVNYWTGQPKAQHHLELQWVTPEELKSLNLPEANKIILDQITNIL